MISSRPDRRAPEVELVGKIEDLGAKTPLFRGELSRTWSVTGGVAGAFCGHDELAVEP